MLLTETTTLYINNNNATHDGGGINAEVERGNVRPPCFFQFDADTLLNQKKRERICVYLQNNTTVTGTTVYGGWMDECYFLIDNSPWENKFYLHQSSGSIFNNVFHYRVNNSRAISSDPIRVCFCENQKLQCAKKEQKNSALHQVKHSISLRLCLDNIMELLVDSYIEVTITALKKGYKH